ncbi:hypothetical protein AGMMS49545_14870 [Betaproteobacteria bacterium]|nr:hypothetical protein AGMMS49545_14870 [Betaproteobacteria bacterium]GHU45333.1 hypothetical protein AGMMS50289_16310 [Betaproteobacteria bacterium]
MFRNTVKTRDGRVFELNAPEEDARITAAAWADPDARPYTDEELEDAKSRLRFGRPPIGQLGKLVEEDALQAKLRGRPKATVTKERITIRLSPDVLGAFRASGNGWQTRVDGALREWLTTHSPAP